MWPVMEWDCVAGEGPRYIGRKPGVNIAAIQAYHIDICGKKLLLRNNVQ